MWTNVTKVIVAFRYCANAPENTSYMVILVQKPRTLVRHLQSAFSYVSFKMDEYEKYLRNEYESLKEETTDVIKVFRIWCIMSMLHICIFI